MQSQNDLKNVHILLSCVIIPPFLSCVSFTDIQKKKTKLLWLSVCVYTFRNTWKVPERKFLLTKYIFKKQNTNFSYLYRNLRKAHVYIFL